MLRKARLAEHLFGADSEDDLFEADPSPPAEEAAHQESSASFPDISLPEIVAEPLESSDDLRPPSPLDDDPLGPGIGHEQLEAFESETHADDPGRVEPEPDLAPPPAPAVDWRAELAEIIGAPSVATCNTLGVCALAKDPGAAAMIASVGSWVAERAQAPTLIIEANAYHSRLTRVMRGRRRGLAEILFDQMDRDEALSRWEGDELALLPLGRSLDRSRRKEFGDRLLEALPGLRRGFDHVLVELPAADDSALATFPAAETVDAVLLLVDPKRSSRRAIAKATRTLRKLGVPLVGCVIDGSGPNRLSRHSHVARRLG